MVAVCLLLIFVGLYGSAHTQHSGPAYLFCRDKCFKLGTFVNTGCSDWHVKNKITYFFGV